MRPTSKSDRNGIIQVRRLLEDISWERGTYSWHVESFPEDRDRQEEVHWDLRVHYLKDAYSFRVQVKTVRKGKAIIKVRHIRDWLELDRDTCIIVYRLDTKEAFWTSPQLLMTKLNGKILKYYTFSKADFNIMSVHNRQQLLEHLKMLRGFKKKASETVSIQPFTFSEFQLRGFNIDTCAVEKFILDLFRGDSRYYNIDNIFYRGFFTRALSAVSQSKNVRDFNQRVFRAFRFRFDTSNHDEQLLKEYLKKWASDIWVWRLSRLGLSIEQ